MPEDKEEIRLALPLNGLAHNVSLKISNDKPEAIVRSLNSKFCTIVTVKKMYNGLLLMDFGHPDIIFTGGQSSGTEVTFRDFEFSPSASIVMPLEAALQFKENLDKALSAIKEDASNGAE